MKKTIILVLLFFTVAGFVASLLMTRLHYKMGGKGLEERSFCHVSEFFDCDTALASRYSSIDTGIKPIGKIMTSEIGVVYFILVMMGLLYSLFSAEAKSTLAFLLTSSLFAVLYSAVLGYLSVAKLGIICLLCFTTYVTNLALLLLLPRAMDISYGRLFPTIFSYMGSFLGLMKGSILPRRALHGITTIAVVVLGVLFFKGLNPQLHASQPKIPKESYLRFYYSTPQKTIETSDRPIWGNQNAKVTIVEFSDFQCPFCRLAAFTLRPTLKEYQENIRFVYMNFPLDNACNPAIERAMHPVSCLAAKAAICSHKQGKFLEYHDLIFENQKKLSREKLLSLADEAKLNRQTFEACLVSDEVTGLLKKDVDEGNQLGVKGTPSVHINGRAFRDWTNPERLRLVIESEISGEKPQGLPPPREEDHSGHEH